MSGLDEKGLEQARKERENVAFHEWWKSSGHDADPIFTLTMENCAHAAWQARAYLSAVGQKAGTVGAAYADLTSRQQDMPADFAAIDRSGLYGEFTPINVAASTISAPSVAEAAEPVAWRCFHCDETFTKEWDARAHFGRDEGCTPACQIKGAEGGLVTALRRAEQDAADAWAAIHNETTDTAKAYHAQAARHREQLIAIEQIGYDRGVADAKAHPETLGLHPAPSPVVPSGLEALRFSLHYDPVEKEPFAHPAADGDYVRYVAYAALTADRASCQARVEELERALRGAETAIAEFYRYWTGGEMRGSYDGKPERDALWKAMHAARTVLARSARKEGDA